MKLSEVINIINDPNIKDEFNYIVNKINDKIYRRFGDSYSFLIPQRGISRIWFPKIGAVRKKSKEHGYTNECYLKDPSIKIPPDEDVDLEFQIIFFGITGAALKPENLRKPKTGNWGIAKETIKKEDINNSIKLLHDMRVEDGKRVLYSHFLHRLALYMTDFLEHPLDILLVDEEMIKGSIGRSHEADRTHGPTLLTAKLVGLSIALKYGIKIDYKMALNILNKSNNQSLQKVKKKDELKKMLHEVKTVKGAMSFESKFLLSFVKDKEAFITELDYTIFEEGANSLFITSGSPVLYYFFAILLDHGTNAWHKVPHINVETLRRYYLETPINEGRLKTAIDYLFTNNTNVKSPFYYIGFTAATENGRAKATFPNEIDEIIELVENYRIYLSKLGTSLKDYKSAKTVINHKAQEITQLEQLMEENIEYMCLKYVEHLEKNNLGRANGREVIKNFLSALIRVKEIFSKENILGVEPKKNLPYDIKLLMMDDIQLYRNGEDVTVYGRIVKRIIRGPAGIKEVDECNEEFNEVDPYVRGTLKEDIVIADEVVRAIYNYKPKGKEGTLEYFYEYQLITMLRIAADSGCRIEEIVNAPRGTLSYLKEHDVHICILGLSKLGERFGIVPVGPETAEMIQRCDEMRQELLPESFVYLKMKGQKGKTEVKYMMQFIKMHRRRVVQVDPNKELKVFLGKICKEANIILGPKRRFHFLRHRAAEYYFFAMSYYDFEYKDDAEYKNSIICISQLKFEPFIN